MYPQTFRALVNAVNSLLATADNSICEIATLILGCGSMNGDGFNLPLPNQQENGRLKISYIFQDQHRGSSGCRRQDNSLYPSPHRLRRQQSAL
jgi:hypothetical protein